jgi:hypothetical protein
MAQQLQVIDLNSTALALPAHLANMPAVVGTIAQGDTRNRISLKGREFHIFKGGVEEGVLETKHADVVIVGAYPYVSRQYFDKAYEEGVAMAPACYSTNGITPAENSSARQADKCEACPQNVKGSSLNGEGKSKACGFFRRIAVILSGDPEFTIFQLDIKSMSLWNDGDASKGYFGFLEYAKKLSAHHIDPGLVITRLRFDPQASVPALQFQAIGYINQEQAAKVVEMVEAGDVKPVLEVAMQAGGDTPAAVAPAQIAPPTKAPAPRVAAPAPASVPMPAPKPAPQPVAVARPAMARPAPPRVTPPATVAMPVEEQDEDAIAAANPALQPVTIKYGQRRATPMTSPVAARPAMRAAPQKATAEEVQQDVDALIAELDG